MLDKDLSTKLESIITEYIGRDLVNHLTERIYEEINKTTWTNSQADDMATIIFYRNVLNKHSNEAAIDEMATNIAEDVGTYIHDEVINAIEEKVIDIISEARIEASKQEEI